MMYKYLVELFFAVLFAALSCADIFSYSNCRDCLRFPSNGTKLSRVERILIDQTNDRLIAGAMNVLFRLEISSMKLSSIQNDSVELPPSQAALQDCLKRGISKVNCQNYIKTLLFDNSGYIFACGTYARVTRCWQFQRASALRPLPSIDGVKIAGTTPLHGHLQNVTATFTSNFLFTGLNFGVGTSRSAVYRNNADPGNPGGVLISDITELVLKDANFVSSFEYKDNFVYFFLREKAIEKGKGIIYARVARVCQYDQGADKYSLKGKFTSFVKTRVLCSVPGDIPFDYNQIQATVQYTDPVTKEDFVYGVFTTPQLGVLGSAVCRYSMNSIVDVFDESQYLQKTNVKGHDGVNVLKAVSPVNLTFVPGRPQCDSSLDTKSYTLNTNVFAIEHPLLADPLESNPAKPLFTRAEMRLTGLVIDHVKRSNGAVVPVMFISSDNGTVFKVFNNISGDHNPIILEQINVFMKPEPIYTIKLYKGAVYIGSESSVVKLPVEHCSQYQACRTCVSSLDPYCGWSNNKCTIFENKEGSEWAQDIIHGNFTKVCPEEPPTCSLIMLKKQVGGTSTLACQVDRGIPLPKVTKWTRDSKAVTSASADFQIKAGKDQYQGLLEIYNFNFNLLGVYECFVSNKMGSSSCAVDVNGTLPVLSSGLVKINGSSLFVCNASGLPTPRVAIHKVIGGTTHVVNSHQVLITADSGQRSYYCTAQNQFGSSFSKAVNLDDKQVKAELRLTNEEWSAELLDEKSEKYKTLTDKVRSAVSELYSANQAFIGCQEDTFSKGSVICKLTLIFAAYPTSTNAKLLGDLQEEVSTGKVGYFTVDMSHPLYVEPTNEQPTTQPVFSTVQVTSNSSPTTPQIQESPSSQQTQGSLDGGLFAVAVVTAVLLSLLLGFGFGVKFHRQFIAQCRRPFGDSDISDGTKNNTIEAIKYMKSPSREEEQSIRNLLKKKRSVTEEDDGSESDDSTAGKIAAKKTSTPSSTKSISPSESIAVTVENKKPILTNGKVSNVC
ncbi:semaphorin-4D-like isoform X1 [Montipora capricornis]|uniref:semaphorin-4D-like isoform X1 n=1 Tax=Montipora capricornis TaxID=246305 RepID=UPI0035F2026F